MFGRDGKAENFARGGVGRGEFEFDGAIVDFFILQWHALEAAFAIGRIQQHAFAHIGLDFFVVNHVQREDDVIGGDGLIIAPFQIRLERE